MRLVVVGGVAAGLSAASRARRLDRSLEIVVLEKGQRISYGACGLPYFIEGQVASIDDLNVRTAEVFERERDIRIRTGCEVVSIQHSKRELLLRGGERVRYDRLVWAAGARAALQPGGPKVFTLHTDVDAEKLRAFLEQRKPRTAAVIGGGYIGLEMATALRTRGLDVTLFHENLSLLNREDDWLTQRLIERLKRCRVDVKLNTPVAAPSELPHDVVLLSAGLRPNAEVPAEAGAECGRSGALRVSERMETSLAGVYAAGDCCEVNHVVSGRPVWIPLGPTATKTGRVAGANAAGGRERFPGVAGTSIVRVAGLSVATTGFSSIQARREGFAPVEAQITARARAKYFRGREIAVQLVAERNSRRLLGAAIVGDEDSSGRINVAATALAAKLKVEDLASLDLAYSPPYGVVMDPLLVAAQQLMKQLD
jgi:CoA-dependent NAD(P)H sulfur oxidoreductase